jgi:hypothetical protein
VEYAFEIVFIAACAVGAIAWVVAAWNLLRIPLNLRPGVDAWATGNPFNHLFAPNNLSEKGLVARRRVWIALGIFLSALIVGFLVGLPAKWAA